MRFVYLDPVLTDDLGYRAITCRLVREELRRLAIPARFFAGADAARELREDCGVLPLFRKTPPDPDALIGWLVSFDAAAKLAVEDMSRIHGLASDDLVYLNHADPAWLMAIIIWAANLGPGQLPIMIVDIGSDPGLERLVGDRRLGLRDPRKDPRAILYRYATTRMPSTVARRMRLATYAPETSKAFGVLLGRKVETLPMVFRATAGRRRRAGERPVAVSIFSDEAADANDPAPRVAASLLRARSDIRLETYTAASAPSHHDVLERSDLVVLAYDPSDHAFSYSSMAAEAIANAIPLVVPEGTPLASLLREFDGPGSTFAAFTADSISAAAHSVLDRFDSCASAAYAASERWTQTHGPGRTVRALLDLAEAMTEADIAGR
ncbi:MAG TPA: hypothetical protein VN823_03755 [Stellaceae bacterium]|nr:hypothetical protein [Stellaceae bacterium]